MAKRTIKIRSFFYYDKDGNPSPTYFRGSKPDLPEEGIKAGEAIGAFEPTQQQKSDAKKASESTAPAGVPKAADLSDDELLAFWDANKPTVPQAINMADGDPAQAQRILKTEEAYTGGGSRGTLVEGLAKIVDTAT